jgi:hypothetical protein
LRILSLNCSRHQLLFDSNKNPPNLTAQNWKPTTGKKKKKKSPVRWIHVW